MIRRLDDDRYARKFTPRRAHKQMVGHQSAALDNCQEGWPAGTAAGLTASPTDNSYASRPPIADLPIYIASALKQSPKAWKFFRSLAPTHRRHFVGWIHTAKRLETREKRIANRSSY